ncbi:MAG TPA: type II toxin-antitoxin system HicA family toxin [Chloroflexota bacterium]|jgi:predicted RNA binding protein YcfA (HicA-like mRNA interferase family)
MSRELTQVELEELLVQLGFQLIASVPGSHRAFRHESTDTLVVLKWDQATPVMPAVVVGTRRLLDEKGIIDKKDFDARTREMTAKHTQRV